jgi:UrcA family protein
MSALITRMRAAAGIVGLMALGAAAAQAQSQSPTAGLLGPDVVVRYGDLDLNTRTGAETLSASRWTPRSC